jgi:hypothetical protein
MSSVNEGRQEGQQTQDKDRGEQGDARHSGEGAASALAQLKTQTKQHRRQSGEGESADGGPGQ